MGYDENLAARLRAHLNQLPGMVEKKMFGGIGFILDGNMALGVLDDYLLVRVSPDQYESLLEQAHVSVMDKFGRRMSGWVVVSPQGVTSDIELRTWIDIGLAAARALPKK